ncbi:hypothetical protein BDF20DRAFT_854168 [Mycotypha africana]|uniref:uncharacterized protein n=1 Tax=Mycotypha africana TaxID=64632 RepID=UPI0023017DCB|nr:uncharacterized protein BDF20DRAFT_854168 [Mycotypha africana]KAI8988155.1 hypothetical protein BDF20DRAFT_854168 [Mycotypha africana]
MQSSHSDYQQANLLSWQQQQNLPQLTAMQLSDRDPSVTIDDLTMSGRMEDEDPENFSGHPNKKSGRRKIKIEYITDKSRRHITFSKRKAGIMKKAYELSTLTGTQLLLLVVSETGLVYTFTTPKLQPLVTKPEGKNLIQSCLNAPDPLMNEASPSSATATIAAINKMTTPLETSTDLKEYQSSLDNNFNPNQMQQSQSMLSNSSNPDILTSPIPSNGSILNPNFRGSDQAVASIYDSNNKVYHQCKLKYCFDVSSNKLLKYTTHGN